MDYLRLKLPRRAKVCLGTRGLVLVLNASATPLLRCQANYARITHTLEARPVADPYTVPSVERALIYSGTLECLVAITGSAGDKNHTFRAHPRSLPVLKRHFDAVALANNASGDCGREAFAEMLALLKAQRLDQFGGGHNLKEAHTPLIIERKGLRIALWGYNEFLPRSFKADYNAPGSAWSEDERVVADIRAARSVHKADLVIPIMHEGCESERTDNARQRGLGAGPPVGQVGCGGLRYAGGTNRHGRYPVTQTQFSQPPLDPGVSCHPALHHHALVPA